MKEFMVVKTILWTILFQAFLFAACGDLKNLTSGPAGGESPTTPHLMESFLQLNSAYDLQNPAPLRVARLMPHHHPKRCTILEPTRAVETFVSGKYSNYFQGMNIYVSTPCLGTDSLGNSLGLYFENLVCAHIAGMHYMSTAKIYEPKNQDQSSPFLDSLPSIMEHSHPQNDRQMAIATLRQKCKCSGSCHEQPWALWTKSLDLIKPLLEAAMLHQLNYFQGRPDTAVTTVFPSDFSNAPLNSSLPLIPDAAIHFRCGDNFIGHYGFVPFSAFKKFIPTSVTTIYVLADRRGRKTTHKAHLAAICDAVFKSLFQYLKVSFPAATIVIKRGDDIYLDFVRLSLAKVVVCSVSTFCLWPAVVNNGSAYFPRTRLIAGGSNMNLGFSWFDNPGVVRGDRYALQPEAVLLNALGGKIVE